MTFRLAAWQEIFELDRPSGLGAIRKGEDLTNEAAGRPFSDSACAWEIRRL